MLDYFLEKLNQISEDTKHHWGKMSAQHMVEHLILSMRMSNGNLNVECINQDDKLPVFKKFLLSDRPMPKEYNNPALGILLQRLQYSTLDDARQQLDAEVKDYELFFIDNPEEKPVNVTFGKLNKDEWDIFHKKHFTHHLSQFGLL